MAKTPRLNYADASNAGLLSVGAQVIPGVKTFPSGIVLGNETLSVYDEGTWTPTYSSSSNLLDSSGNTLSNSDITWGTATYTRIGNRVFATISTISGIKINAINTDTSLSFGITGLPTPNGSAAFCGGCSCYLPAPQYEIITTVISGNGSVVVLYVQSHGPVTTLDTLTISAVGFSYYV